MWLKHRSEKEKEKAELEQRLATSEEAHLDNLKTVKKERQAEIYKLRKEMLFSIRDVKIQMLSMNEENLKGTTKLTKKQNIQLSSELDYQSQNIEQLTYQNEKMRGQIKLLKVELEEHAEVENELAKRSHFCQRVITKYKTQVKVLKEEIAAREA